MSRPDPASLQLPQPGEAYRVVPPTGITATLTIFVAGAMAFLCVFALALLFSTDRLAERWGQELARTATLRISAPPDQMEAQVAAALAALKQTPGVASARAMDDEEEKKLLEPWFGPDLPLDDLPIPRLIEITETDQGFDAEGLKLRLVAEAPGAVLDDHTRWRAPLVAAASRLRLVGWLSILLIAGSLAAMVTVAASASLAANARVIDVLRLIGAEDSFVVRAFTRRFAIRALIGATAGTVAGMAAILLIPRTDTATAFLTGLGFRGVEWIVPVLIPVLAAATAFGTTRAAAMRRLQETR